MGLIYPLFMDAFFARLPIGSITFDCPEQVKTSRTRGGEILAADIGPRLWLGQVTLGRMTLGRMTGREARPIRA